MMTDDKSKMRSMREGTQKKAGTTSKPGTTSRRGKNGATSAEETASEQTTRANASRLIDERIESLGDWRGGVLAEARRLLHEAVPDVVEEWKWKGTPVWSHAGNLCTGETYKQVVKFTFPRGASLDDPKQLFNSSLEGKARRAIDIREGETLDAEAFKSLIRAAAAENGREKSSKSKPSSNIRRKSRSTVEAKESLEGAGGQKVVLLSGGNPQIAKADGDAPVQAYIAAMPGWKSGFGKRLDDLIVRTVPHVKKAVRWNSPFYGVEGQGWFLSFHVFTRYVKVTFFNGMSLQPIPPGGTEKSKESRWIDVYENDQFNEQQWEAWVRQAADLPGWIP